MKKNIASFFFFVCLASIPLSIRASEVQQKPSLFSSIGKLGFAALKGTCKACVKFAWNHPKLSSATCCAVLIASPQARNYFFQVLNALYQGYWNWRLQDIRAHNTALAEEERALQVQLEDARHQREEIIEVPGTIYRNLETINGSLADQLSHNSILRLINGSTAFFIAADHAIRALSTNLQNHVEQFEKFSAVAAPIIQALYDFQLQAPAHRKHTLEILSTLSLNLDTSQIQTLINSILGNHETSTQLLTELERFKSEKNTTE